MTSFRITASFVLLFAAAYALRLLYGLWAEPIQPMEDEIQTYLVGLKYYTTGDWPFYCNDMIKPPENLELIGQDPGALMGLLIGLPFFLWPHPIAPFLFLNLLSLAALGFLAWYAWRRLPALSPWFIFPWMLTAPWCVHYSTNVMNVSYTLAAACLFYPAFLESLPNTGIGFLRRPWANAFMGFSLAFWMQFHRTWVLTIPFLAVSFYFQWKNDHKKTAPLFFLLGALPPLALLVPTFFRDDYRFLRDTAGMAFGFNPANLAEFPRVLAEFLSLACFQLPRFIGGHTDERLQFLLKNWLIAPGIFLWVFGILQAIVLLVYFFDSKNPRGDWKPIRLMVFASLLLVFASFLFTLKKPYVNHFYEFLPLVMLYSLYIWERWWALAQARILLWLFLACALLFQAAYPFTQLPSRKSFYLKYHDAIAQAIDQKDYRVLGERRAGSFY